MNARTFSTAVMARRVEPADSLDFFPTPPWATRALLKHVLPGLDFPAGGSALDPACGEGHMATVLAEHFGLVQASDIFDYGFGLTADFLHPDMDCRADWIITNPPFNLATDFALKALRLARRGVALLVRMQFLEGEDRLNRLFAPHPPTLIAQFSERVPMHRGRWVVTGTTATAYCWVVWHKGRAGPTSFTWIPKSRVALSRHDDWLRFAGCTDIPKAHPAFREGVRGPARSELAS